MFYIMKAHHLTTSGRKLGLKKILRDEPNCTVVAATREVGYSGKQVPCFILGAPGDYGIKPGDKTDYTIDTGMGHKGTGGLVIEHIFQFCNGQIVEEDGRAVTPHTMTNFMDARYTWVMK